MKYKEEILEAEGQVYSVKWSPSLKKHEDCLLIGDLELDAEIWLNKNRTSTTKSKSIIVKTVMLLLSLGLSIFILRNIVSSTVLSWESGINPSYNKSLRLSPLGKRETSPKWINIFEKTSDITYGLSPPWYPTPKGGTTSKWTESYKKAQKLVNQMSLTEKVNITTGTGWQMGLAVGNTGPAIHAGFPSLALQDGPLGIRFSDNITAFPAGITTGATWNKQLMYARGKAMGKEARMKGVNVLLGPCVGPLGRMPAGGRNWEGFGADPVLQGIAAAETIRGIQEEGVMATVKHFVGNEQEHYRQRFETHNNEYALSVNIDDRTLHELYGWPFQNTIKVGVASVMCSYQMVNNSYACQNSKLINGYLKDELGFSGFVQSDWAAQDSGVASALAGLDMSMPGDGLRMGDGKPFWGQELTKSIFNGSVPIERLNDMVTRVVAAWYQLGQDDRAKFDRNGPNFSSWTKNRTGVLHPGSPDDQPKVVVNQYIEAQGSGNETHSTIARQVAAEGTVLLKNSGILPLNPNYSPENNIKLRIGIFGEDSSSGKGPNFCEDRGCNQGTLGSGWGSGSVEFPYLISPADALKKALDKDKFNITVFPNNTLSSNTTTSILKDQDICIVFASADSGEGYITYNGNTGDRNNLFLQNGGDELIKGVANSCGDSNGDTIVVIHSVGPVIMESFVHHSNIKAIIWANLPGQESGNALTDVLLGKVNPSGKLPYSIGKSLEDYGPGAKVLYNSSLTVPQLTFEEGLYIDYRHFERYDIKPTYPFGFGLSYTKFEYNNLVVTKVLEKSELPSPRPAGVNPPTYPSTIPDIRESLFPTGFRKLKKYIYPYISNITDVKESHYPYPDGYYDEQSPSPAGGDEGGNPDLWNIYASVSVEITNIGHVAGKEVAQLYVSFEDVEINDSEDIDFPIKVLRQFEKVDLDVGETKTIQFHLTRRDLSYWDVIKQNWVMPTGGCITLLVGASSQDLRLSGYY
ncbi:putative beta-glucosidase E [Erysiphe necator]|uniref:Probable beta-glucosidase E n=1 Tax=Uncinula necator TaxID=52586 RepID=A0A0B1PAL0_UNCNE|nr:putative beta-glucosidase E [Erysiphe necator]KHJ35268.1 putative glycoside hydrolase family 3 protein [Erysiphe necator]